MSLYTEIDMPQRPTDDPYWQESFVLIFRDPLSGAVGFLRTGCYPNLGTTQTHWGMALPDGTRFRRHWLDRKMEAGDRTENSVSSGSMKYSIPNMEYVRFEANDKDAEVDLRLYDWFPSQDWAFIGGPHHGKELGKMSAADQRAMNTAGHPESAGRLEGRIRLGDRWIDIENGIGYREHGMGARPAGTSDEDTFRAARSHFGTVGPDLSWSLVTIMDAKGHYHKLGFVMLNGKREVVTDVEHVNFVLGDGISSIGGRTVAKLENGEVLRIEVEAVDGVVTSTLYDNGGPGSSSAGVEVLSIPHWNGRAGISDFNMIDNAHRGNKEVGHLLYANHENGLSRRIFNASLLR